MCITAAAIVSPASGDGFCPSDINNDSVVDAGDLIAVLDAWGSCMGACQADIAPDDGNGVVNAADLFAVAAGWGECDPGKALPLNYCGEIALHDGNQAIANMAISGTHGIMGENDDHVGRLVVRNCTIHSVDAGIYCGSCDDVRLHNVLIQTGTGGDDYTIRGTFARYLSRNCEFISNDKSWRIYGLVNGGSSTDDVIVGGIMWVGGGAADSWVNELPFRNFTFTRTRIRASSVEIMGQTSDVTFNNVDFEGTDHISIHGPAHNITFNSCDHLPEIRMYDNPYNVQVNP